MDMKNFFVFRSQFLASTVQAHAVVLEMEENGSDDQRDLLFKGNYKNINFPVLFKQDYGEKLRDILDTGWPSLYLISDRLKAVLKENDITGWKTFPIELYDKKNNKITGYHGFSIIGRSGPTYYDNCEIIEKRYVPNGPICKFYKGVYIAEWDGSDFFLPGETCAVYITKKAADVLKKNKITNICLTNLTDKETDIDNVPKKGS